MASKEKVSIFHDKIAGISLSGSISAILATTGFIATHGTKYEKMNSTKIVLILLYIVSLVLIVLSLSLYHDEKEENATDVTSALLQLRNSKAGPTINEAALVSSIGGVLVLAGVYLGVQQYNKNKMWGKYASGSYASGWILLAISAAMNSKAASSVRSQRLVWTLPSVVLIVGGTFSIPWTVMHKLDTGIPLVAITLGYMGFNIGSSIVSAPPTAL
jgi:uncharacterized membrane protein YeiB